MKKILYNYINCLQLFLVVAVFMSISACNDDTVEAPFIAEVRNYAASPEDTLIQTINADQWIVISGNNLGEVSQVQINGVPASINPTLLTGSSIIVQVPSIDFPSVPVELLNSIIVFNEAGKARYDVTVTGGPVITHVRNYADAPNDTILHAVFPGQKINIIGYNLKNVSEIAFQGIGVDLAGVVYTDTSAIVTVPEDLSGADASKANTISVTTSLGDGTYTIKIIGPPSITGVSYEMPKEGDQVYLYGYNFTSIESLTFAGVIISQYEVSEDEQTIGFIAPALTQTGPVEIITSGGSFTTAYNVNDPVTGALSNFEWGDNFKWDWWGGASLAVEADYPEYVGNGGQFLVLNLAAQGSGEGFEWNAAVRMSGGSAPTWFSSASDLDDPASSWALKFEISIPDDWNGSTMVIKTNDSDYMVRYEPWQVTTSNTEPYKTDGWQTVTIPFTSFRKNDNELGDGKGDPITKISDLFNQGTGVGDFYLYMHNYGNSDTKTGFKAAFDNFRVVKR